MEMTKRIIEAMAWFAKPGSITEEVLNDILAKFGYEETLRKVASEFEEFEEYI